MKLYLLEGAIDLFQNVAYTPSASPKDFSEKGYFFGSKPFFRYTMTELTVLEKEDSHYICYHPEDNDNEYIVIRTYDEDEHLGYESQVLNQPYVLFEPVFRIRGSIIAELTNKEQAIQHLQTALVTHIQTEISKYDFLLNQVQDTKKWVERI